MGKAPQRFLPNLLLSVASLVVFGGAVEGVSRWVEKRSPPPSEDGALPKWTEGWGAEFYTLGSDTVGFPPRHRFNNEGLRDRSRPVSKAEGLRRVACLGDSVTFGHGVNPAQAWPQRLETRLRSAGREVDVLNVALPAWSTRQQLIAYQRIARRYHPDQVLLGVCLNDIPELTANLSPPPAILSWLHRRLAVYRLLADAPGLELRSVKELCTDHDSRRVRESFDRFFAEVRALRREVESDGASFALVVFPFRFQVEPGAPSPRAQARILAFCEKEGIRCLDLLPAFVGLGTAAFLDHDHLTPAGGQRAAQAVEDSGLLLAGPSAPEVLRARFGDEAGDNPPMERLVGALRDGDAAVRAAAAWALGRHLAGAKGESGNEVAALAEALSDDAERVRLASARALDQEGTAGAFPALFRALRDQSEPVRWAAAEALWDGGVAEPRQVAGLVGALDSSDAQVRAFAVWSLGRIGPPAGSSVPRLAALLPESEPALRSRIAQALGGIGPDAAGAVPALVAALADRSETVRREAARALGRIGPAAKPAIPALTRAHADGNDGVRQEAERALERIGASP